MGKRTSKKYSQHRAQGLKQGKVTAVGNKSTTSSQVPKSMPNKGNKPKNWWQPTLSGVFAFVADRWWVSMLIDKSFIGGYILFLVSNGLLLGWVIYLSVGWLCRKCHFVKFTKQIGIASALVAFLVFTFFISPLFIGYFVKSQGTIEFPTWVNDSQQVLVHYGSRPDDFFWTNTTIGQLEQKSTCSLNVSGQEIFTIHTDGRRLYIDAALFAGYTNQIVPDYTTIGNLTDFSIEISGYFVTDSTAIGKNFVLKTQATEVKNKALAPPVIMKDNHLINAPPTWRMYETNTALEVDNEHGIPVLIMKYNSQYDVTISGLFLTSFGILKVDNTENVIFEFADSPFELNVYRVNRVYLPSILDWFHPEKAYILLAKGR